MIEGRRHLPFYRGALQRNRDNLAGYVDCGKCKRNHSKENRQRLMSCGYEQRLEGSDRYVDPGYPADAFGRPTTCIGYTGKLPAVLEADALMVDWERGTLEQAIGGAVPEILLDTLRDLEWSTRAAEAFAFAERAKPTGKNR